MSKSKNRTAAPVNKQITEPTVPEAPTTNPANDPTVVPPVVPETETPDTTTQANDQPAGADNSVEVINPFYDLQGKVTRGVGDVFKTTETRAAELRGHKLIK